MKIKPVTEIKDFCQNVLSETDVTVWDVDFKNGDFPTLTVYIHRDGGVDLDTCEKVSNLLDAPLDQLDPTFGEAYSLNVSSRGLDWAFRSDEDYISHIGSKVEVKLKSAVKGKKFYDGELIRYEKTGIVLKVDDKTTLTFDMKNVVKVNEYIDLTEIS